MKRVRNAVHGFSTIALAVALALAGGTALAKQGPPTGGEGEGNRLSYPVIFPEGVTPAGFPAPSAWTFATITDTSTCTTGAPVLDTDLCYFDGSQVWWLAARAGNFWKAFSLSAAGTGAVTVTAVDVGDKLESGSLNLTRIRTEFTLYQNANLDSRFISYIPTFTNGVVEFPFADDSPCKTPTTALEVGCFAAFRMSDAVPGTEKSIDEIQGTDFGVNTSDDSAAHLTATGLLIDPTYKTVIPAGDTESIPVHATVYSSCARLLIQKLGPLPASWNPVAGQWDNASAPVVNVATYADLGQGLYSAEINAGGNLIYGYNWNATRDNQGPGTYRLTFVLDGTPRCARLNAQFDATSVVANSGEVAAAVMIPKGDLMLNGGEEGGLVYIDLTVVGKGGGSGGKGPKPRP